MKISYKFYWLSLIILFTALFFPFNGKVTGASYDKLAHLLLFAFVSMNTFFYFFTNKKLLVFNLIFVFSLPLTTEILQLFIKGRHFEVNDIIADTLGILFGALIYFLLKSLITKIYGLLGEHNQQ